MNNEQALSQQEAIRYARHLSLPDVGLEGQKKLRDASVLIVGAGGLGSPVALYLAAAGVGRLGIVDFDRVDPSNLQRQIIHRTRDVGRSKVDSAAEAIHEINPFVHVDQHKHALNSENAKQIVVDYSVVIDGTDNFATRYLVNDVCVLLKIPNCYGSIFQFEGQASLFGHIQGQQRGPCYRCLYPEPPPPGAVPNCAEGGVLGVLPGIIGTIQATEAIKIILGRGESLSGRLLLLDALEMRFREMQVRRDLNCPVCGDHPTITSLIDHHRLCGPVHCGAAESPRSAQTPEIEVKELEQRMKSGNAFQLLDVREPHEYEICNLGGILIPLGRLSQRHHELDRDTPIIVHCKSGSRSAQAVSILFDLGFTDVKNLAGGLDAWSLQIDPFMPKG
ncbi:molybdopterin-synthase adenylyltransferase MoeB [Novipirellula artificiosorum]|uniref:Molybdopterin-synthase adenylyltransferase n=1 Tax=Novipirellula artificiosorum TaxID=2528016 RepID=A0A5C6DRT4_9BACT|nr:molybdopterin-synthase adenylyltransferase MoeB [Novipirellula artificiosorum]TWU38261.1 putative adenylyltransferase/sulfurtransferase MoeZ [Novipirellula artificiosorum]